MSELDWSDLPERLARIGEQRLEPPLTPAEMASLEARIGLELPYEYRHILLHAGSGGPGPGRGLFPVRRTNGEWRWHTGGADLVGLDALARPFPHIEAYDPYLASGLPGAPAEEDFATRQEYIAAERAYEKRREAIEYDPGLHDGLLFLEDGRNGLRSALVVTGPSRGEMWSDDDTWEGRIFRPDREYPGMERIGFARWYYRWLEWTEARLEAEKS